MDNFVACHPGFAVQGFSAGASRNAAATYGAIVAGPLF